MKKELDLSGIEAKWAFFDICMEQGKYDEAQRILERNPEMLEQVEREMKSVEAEGEMPEEELEESYRKFVERLKEEGIWQDEE